MKIQVMRRLITRDKKGRILTKSKWKPCNSLVFQFLQIIYALNDGNESVSTKDTGGNMRNIAWGSTTTIMAGVGDSAKGIVVGTGTNAEDNLDYQLQTQIAHGGGGGQLEYGSQGIVEAAEVGVNVEFSMSRNFENTSGGAITVEEIGLYVAVSGGAGTFNFCVLRDLETQAVADGVTLTVQYIIRTAV